MYNIYVWIYLTSIILRSPSSQNGPQRTPPPPSRPGAPVNYGGTDLLIGMINDNPVAADVIFGTDVRCRAHFSAANGEVRSVAAPPL